MIKCPKLLIRLSLLFSLVIILSNCATHPTISASRMQKGDKEYGYTFALENVLPYGWVRYGLSDKNSIGFRLGLPIYGTGLDFSRLLFSRGNKWDLLNLSWSLNPNQNFDFTYYKFSTKNFKKREITTWWGMRGMYIHNGISGNSSTRVGILMGGRPTKRIGYEIGYFHDFSSMPLAKVFSFGWKPDSPENIKRYGDTPHVDPASGLPSEYSRLTGISLQIFFLVSAGKE